MDHSDSSERKPYLETHVLIPALLGLSSGVVILISLMWNAFAQKPIPSQILSWCGGILSGVMVEFAFSSRWSTQLLRLVREIVARLDDLLKGIRERLVEAYNIARTTGSEIQRASEQSYRLRGELEVLPPMTQQVETLIAALQQLDQEVTGVNAKIIELEQRISDIQPGVMKIRRFGPVFPVDSCAVFVPL